MAQQKKPPPQDLALEKGMPQAASIERLVLGATFSSPGQASIILESLTVSDFYIRSNELVFLAMKKCSDMSLSVDRVTTADRLMIDDKLDVVGGMSYLVSLDEGLPDIVDIHSYIRILKEKAKLRELIQISQRAINQTLLGTDSADEILEGLNRSLYKSFTSAEKAAVQSMAEYIENHPGGINSLLQPFQTSPGLHTGFDDLDEITDGFHDAEIFTIGALPRVGKSAFALGVAQNVARRGGRVVFFSLEMPKRQVFNRLVCQNAEVSVNRFRSGNLDKDERIRIAQSAGYLAKLPLLIDDSSGMKVPDIAMKIRREQDKGPVSLYVIDFVQLLRASSQRGTENDRLTEICTDLQNLCKLTKIPLLLLSQLNRGEKGKRDARPVLESLRSSGMIEVVSNVVGFLHREEVFHPEDLQHRGKAELIVEKNREGETKTINLEFRGYLAKFSNKV